MNLKVTFKKLGDRYILCRRPAWVQISPPHQIPTLPDFRTYRIYSTP